MCFEILEKCPLLEDEKSIWDEIPYCVMLYDKLTLQTLKDWCHKDYTECPTYIKALEETKKNRPAE